MDRVAILVTGCGGVEKLLGVPKMERGTGKAQAQACLSALKEWSLCPHVQGLVFDTTVSNTGLHHGACVLIEEGLGRELVWIACRHHVHEVVLTSVFRAAFGPTSGPDTGLFKRFQESWRQLNPGAYRAPDDQTFAEIGQVEARSESIKYLKAALQRDKQPQADYKELFELCIVFLGGGDENTRFRPPGATHHARFMGFKALYCLKIDLFQDQFKLSPREAKAVQTVSLFVALVYARFWNEAPLAIKAPLNDVFFLQALQNYPDRIIAKSASKAFRRHLWSLSEHLAGLGLFDDRVDDTMKVRMVESLGKPKIPENPRRKQVEEDELPDLASCITERTAALFDLLRDGGQELAKEGFLKQPPCTWSQDPTFLELQEAASGLSCVNNVAERGIALIQTYNKALTRDEEQKQFLLRLVAEHRQRIPEPAKAALME